MSVAGPCGAIAMATERFRHGASRQRNQPNWLRMLTCKQVPLQRFRVSYAWLRRESGLVIEADPATRVAGRVGRERGG
eukprot:5668718-Pyramimonas_sp.AAC.1